MNLNPVPGCPKLRIDDLAVFGGQPAFAEPIHVGRPNLGDREDILASINGIFDRRWLTNNGPLVQELERRIAEFLGVRHCLLTCNGTVALELAIRALDLKGEVIVPGFTFAATAHALQWQEVTPVFCDVDPQTHAIDAKRVEEMLTPRTSGIIGVHIWGQPCDVEALAEIARRRSLKLLLDAAHAFGCSHRGRMIGSFGHAEVFSFHATKFFNTGEGGAVATNDDTLARKIRLMRNFGFDGYDTVVYVGTNGKMSELAAALGLAGLKAVDAFEESNRQNYRTYVRELEGIPGLILLHYDEGEKRNYQYIVLEIDPEAAGLTRDELHQILWAERILARRYFYPGCHRMEPYRSHFPHAGLLLPQTERLASRVLTLPTGTAVTPEQISDVCRIIRFAISRSDEIRARLKSRVDNPTS